MQVILTKDVDTLGSNGDIIEVSDGYYRNYLGPRNMAVIATKGSLADLQRRIDRIRAKAEKKHQEDLAKAEKVNALQLITLEANAGDTGKLYGTITTKELTKVLQEKTGYEIERRNVNVDHPINKVGEYTVYVKFSAKVSAQVKLAVKAIKAKHEEFVLEDAFAGEEN
ncbi:50S ribosomal protein L9 [Vampirovibrio chlorellavorus]|uniref:50S ribosomal protein L9 n=1 Tax=Vampirovibrio chlorellavorus TaxID=758823 RepID=UPI0026EF6052|nr:50S ribosomal protein L9 [Vampirovibrio chlorellavorus]